MCGRVFVLERDSWDVSKSGRSLGAVFSFSSSTRAQIVPRCKYGSTTQGECHVRPSTTIVRCCHPAQAAASLQYTTVPVFLGEWRPASPNIVGCFCPRIGPRRQSPAIEEKGWSEPSADRFFVLPSQIGSLKAFVGLVLLNGSSNKTPWASACSSIIQRLSTYSSPESLNGKRIFNRAHYFRHRHSFGLKHSRWFSWAWGIYPEMPALVPSLPPSAAAKVFRKNRGLRWTAHSMYSGNDKAPLATRKTIPVPMDNEIEKKHVDIASVTAAGSVQGAHGRIFDSLLSTANGYFGRPPQWHQERAIRSAEDDGVSTTASLTLTNTSLPLGRQGDEGLPYQANVLCVCRMLWNRAG